MTLEVFSRDWVPLLQLVVTAAGLASLWLLYRQFRAGVRWNKVNAHMQYFSDFPDPAKRDELDSHLRRLNVRNECIELDEPLNQAEVEGINQDGEAVLAVKRFLNDAERLCIAVNAGVIDEGYAYAENSYEIVVFYRRFEMFIQRRIEIREDEEIYADLKRTALRWKERADNTRVSRQREIATLNEKLRDTMGVTRRYP